MDEKLDFQFELSSEQQEAFNRLVEIVEKVRDAILEMVQAVIDAIHKAFEGVMRLMTKNQLIKWRLPHRWAEWLSRHMPAWLAFDIAQHWFYSKVHALS